MGFIYKITNKTNGKAYIGKTLQTPEKRFKEHCADSKKDRCKNRPLYRAFNKYGINNFSLEVIEECENSKISQQEIYWINYFDTYKNGYNATKGGDGKCYINEEQVIELYNKLHYCTKVAEELNISSNTVSNILRRNKIDVQRNYYKHYCSNNWKGILNDEKSINMFDKNGTFLKSFDSIADAARFLLDNNLSNSKANGLRGHLSEACRGKRKTVSGFIWKFKE